MTKEEFIVKARKIHGNKYDYSKVEYKNNKTKVCVICPTHGEFFVKPNNHLMGSECPLCASEKRNKSIREKRGLTKEIFVERSSKIHSGKYDYSKVEYINTDTKVCIICPIHGEFWQIPYLHMKGQGCPICGAKKRKKSIKDKMCLSLEEFVNKANKVHGNKYDYSKVEYKNSKTNICIICKEHGEFWQTPSHHLRGCGCQICNESRLEKEIRLLLSENKIPFIQWCDSEKLNWLKRQHLDFYLPNHNIAIECQGEQHFTSVEHFGGENNYEKVILNDLKKKKLCEENGIKLLYYTNYKCEESKNMIFDKYKILELL